MVKKVPRVIIKFKWCSHLWLTSLEFLKVQYCFNKNDNRVGWCSRPRHGSLTTESGFVKSQITRETYMIACCAWHYLLACKCSISWFSGHFAQCTRPMSRSVIAPPICCRQKRTQHTVWDLCGSQWSNMLHLKYPTLKRTIASKTPAANPAVHNLASAFLAFRRPRVGTTGDAVQIAIQKYWRHSKLLCKKRKNLPLGWCQDW